MISQKLKKKQPLYFIFIVLWERIYFYKITNKKKRQKSIYKTLKKKHNFLVQL
jgi:hypothetical protein